MFPFQTHPNVDKKLFTAESQIGLKNPEKSFPINSDVGVLKWRLQTTEESFIPLTSECACAWGLGRKGPMIVHGLPACSLPCGSWPAWSVAHCELLEAACLCRWVVPVTLRSERFMWRSGRKQKAFLKVGISWG